MAKCPIDNECELDQGEYCSWESECHKHREYLDSPEKAESDRRDAENNARIREALDRGETPDPPF
ncbi:hypothetical protein QUA70_19800 [Microcoleus sp. LAD1_D5]